jgi:Protein of unknown function (DUF3662)/FHA domain
VARLPKVSILDAFEARLDRLVNGAFARAFTAEVQPIEIAAALHREMDDRAAVIDKARTITPNVFHLDLSSRDFERLTVFSDALKNELDGVIVEHAQSQGYVLVGPAEVFMAEDADLDVGVFRVRSQARPAAGAPAIAGTPRLVFPDGKEVPLVSTVSKLGRGTDVNVHVDDSGASRIHCEIVLGSPIKIRDLGSTNGTFVNGERISEVDAIDGTRVTIGTTTIVLRTD